MYFEKLRRHMAQFRRCELASARLRQRRFEPGDGGAGGFKFFVALFDSGDALVQLFKHLALIFNS